MNRRDILLGAAIVPILLTKSAKAQGTTYNVYIEDAKIRLSDNCMLTQTSLKNCSIDTSAVTDFKKLWLDYCSFMDCQFDCAVSDFQDTVTHCMFDNVTFHHK